MKIFGKKQLKIGKHMYHYKETKFSLIAFTTRLYSSTPHT